MENNQSKFLDSLLGKTINGAIDIGLRAILPDLIENQIIEIKNSLFENGLNGGIKQAINTIVDFTKSTTGIVTGRFDNIEQINFAIGKGGLIDTISNIFDFATNKIYEKGYINSTIKHIIKNGKNTILNTISNNIKKELDNQNDLLGGLEKNIKKWKDAYNIKDLNSMNKIYNAIEKKFDKIIPIENICKEIRNIEAIHEFIKNNGNSISISDIEREVIEKFANIT
ncbi:MAG: hypothetical protein HFJ55_06820 [Clostridia bacterium]|nr:hypothetical protein [Clostridia bacterium]